MKANWGISIGLFYAFFMIVMIYFVVKTTTYDNSLVMDNYYEQDLKYQAHYDKKVNTQQLEQQVAVEYKQAQKIVEFRFPKGIKNISGTVQFFRPSTKHRDIVKSINTDENGQMIIDTDQLKTGRWKILLDWKGDQKAYYTETDIVL